MLSWLMVSAYADEVADAVESTAAEASASPGVYESLDSVGDALTETSSFLPDFFSGVLGVAFGLIFAWVLISLALKVIGIFFHV